jgi:hypothetical protein
VKCIHDLVGSWSDTRTQAPQPQPIDAILAGRYVAPQADPKETTPGSQSRNHRAGPRPGAEQTGMDQPAALAGRLVAALIAAAANTVLYVVARLAGVPLS